MGLTLLGIAIWMAVEFNFMVIILGHYYSVFVYMAIATGGFIGIAAIIGCIGTLNLHKTILQIVSITRPLKYCHKNKDKILFTHSVILFIKLLYSIYVII